MTKRMMEQALCTLLLSSALLQPSYGADAAQDLKAGMAAMKDAHYDQAVKSLTRYLAQTKGIDNKTLSAVYAARAESQFFCKNYQACIDDASEAIKNDPACGAAYHHRAMAMIQIGKPVEAFADLNRALELQPKNAHSFGMRTVANINRKDYAAAVADATNAIKLDPKYADAYLLRGQAYDSMNKLDLALLDFACAYKLHPSDWSVKRSYIRMLVLRGKNDEAQKLLDSDPKLDADGFVRNERGMRLYNAKKYDEAIKVFDKLIADKNNKMDSPYLFRGESYRYIYKGEPALKDYDEFLRRQPGYRDAYLTKSLALMLLKRHKEALAELNRLIGREPEFAAAYASRGECLRSMGRDKEGLADLLKAIKLDPSNSTAHCNLGQIYQDRMEDERALAEYKTALKLDPSNEWALRKVSALEREDGRVGDLAKTTDALVSGSRKDKAAFEDNGKSFFLLGKFKEAAEQYSKALALDPAQVKAREKRARCYVHTKDYAKACADFDLVIKKWPGRSDLYMDRAKCNIALSKFESALTDLNTAVKLSPRDSALYQTRAQVFDALGKFDLADADRRRRRELDQNFFGDVMPKKP